MDNYSSFWYLFPNNVANIFVPLLSVSSTLSVLSLSCFFLSPAGPQQDGPPFWSRSRSRFLLRSILFFPSHHHHGFEVKQLRFHLSAGFQGSRFQTDIWGKIQLNRFIDLITNLLLQQVTLPISLFAMVKCCNWRWNWLFLRSEAF